MITLGNVIERVNSTVNSFLWGPLMLIVFIGCGAYFSLKTSFLQLRCFPFIFKNLFSDIKQNSKKEINSFKALATALSGTMGVGNIIGVTAAIISGGPGAVFWMWASAFFGMMTKYAEATLAIVTRRSKNGENYGGAMYYIEDGTCSRCVAVLFSVFCLLASYGVGNMAQSNAAASIMNDVFKIPKPLIGTAVCIITAVVIFGGIKRISLISSAVIPALSAVYILMSLTVIIANISSVPKVFSCILSDAFSFRAAKGGALGFLMSKSVRIGLARGVFTNEAGMGSASIAHASGNESSPAKQGAFGIFEVFLDTFVITTLTALAALCSGAFSQSSSASGTEVAIKTFSSVFGKSGEIITAVSLLLFALPSIFGWAYYGEQSVIYIFGKKTGVRFLFKLSFSLAAVLGAVIGSSLVFEISDTFNGLMSIPNIVALLILSPQVISETNKLFK